MGPSGCGKSTLFMCSPTGCVTGNAHGRCAPQRPPARHVLQARVRLRDAVGCSIRESDGQGDAFLHRRAACLRLGRARKGREGEQSAARVGLGRVADSRIGGGNIAASPAAKHARCTVGVELVTQRCLSSSSTSLLPGWTRTHHSSSCARSTQAVRFGPHGALHDPPATSRHLQAL